MSTKKGPRVPDWAREPFVNFLDHIEQSHDFYHLSISGLLMIIHRSRRMEELTEQLKKLDRESGFSRGDVSRNNVRDSARKEAELAQREADQGFPILHQQTTVDLWGTLEFLIRNFFASWLANETTPTRAEAVRKIKVRLADYEAMSEDDRYHYLIDELERDLGAPFKQGVNRFEALLSVFGFSGRVKKSIRKDLFELSQVRNVIVHRRGIADRRLVEACPWLSVKAGEPLTITPDAHRRYFEALYGYVKVLLARVTKHFASVPERAGAAKKNKS